MLQLSGRKINFRFMCESYKQLFIFYDIKIVVTFYQILIINPCVSDGNPITS